MSEAEHSVDKPRDVRVVIVEDHRGLRAVLTRVLQYAEGITCCGGFSGGQEALEALPDLMPDIVTLDLSMPGMDGIQVLEVVRDRWPTMRCILLSGHDEEAYAKQALDAGASGYIVKGDAPELLEAIRAVTEGKRFVSSRFAPLLEDADRGN